MPARLYTKLRYAKLRGGLHAHAPPPVCDGAAGGGKAHWRQLNGSWRRADGTLCVPVASPPASIGAEAGGEAAGAGSADGIGAAGEEEEEEEEEEGEEEEEESMRIRGFEALTTMDALLRNADTVANRELVLRGLWAVAAATSLVSTAELIGAMVDAGDAHPSLRSELLRLGLPWASQQADSLRRKESNSRLASLLLINNHISPLSMINCE